ncbi:hypothetical protein V8C44DRAFT_36496 [Trichoderma aethiopicum]
MTQKATISPAFILFHIRDLYPPTCGLLLDPSGKTATTTLFHTVAALEDFNLRDCPDKLSLPQGYRLVDMASNSSTIVRCQATLECGSNQGSGVSKPASLAPASSFVQHGTARRKAQCAATVRLFGSVLQKDMAQPFCETPSLATCIVGAQLMDRQSLCSMLEREAAACRRRGVVRMHVRSSGGILLRYFAIAQVPASCLISPAWVLNQASVGWRGSPSL